MSKPQSTSTESVTLKAMDYLETLGDTPYICKIASRKLVISKSMMEIFGYNTE